jgi:hypothetical protein
MQLLFPLVSLALFSLLYATYIKLSARILHGTIVSWAHSFIFSFLMVFLIVLGRVTANITGISLPLGLSLTYGLTLHLGLGGLFFKKRIINQQGQLLGWRGGMQLTAIRYGLFCLTGAVLWTVLYFVGPPT